MVLGCDATFFFNFLMLIVDIVVVVMGVFSWMLMW